MCSLECFVVNLHEYLVGIKSFENSNIIRIHSRRLEKLGEISFPLNIKNWYQILDKKKLENNNPTSVFDYMSPAGDLNTHLENLKAESLKWILHIVKCEIQDDNVHVFLNRPSLFQTTVELVLKQLNNNYGKCEVHLTKVNLITDETVASSSDLLKVDLTTLRLLIIKDVTFNLLNFATSDNISEKCDVILSLNSSKSNNIICGPILNENGLKDTKTTSSDFYNKRISDMRMMALHKYGMQVKPSSNWNSYLEKLGKASVTIEMLANKPHKACKITLNNLEASNKGAAFIFYNCARLAALFREFDKRISENVYPTMPDVDNVDFTLLNQPEEWELLYVYILQFPMVVKNCIKDITKGILNPQYLITFLSNLASVFSVYYRRVRILIDPREHLFAVIQSRVYLLKALQVVFHNSLHLLNIEPIKQM